MASNYIGQTQHEVEEQEAAFEPDENNRSEEGSINESPQRNQPNQNGILSPQQSTPTMNVSSVSTDHDYALNYSEANSSATEDS